MGDLSKTNKIASTNVVANDVLEKRMILGSYDVLITVKPANDFKFDIDSFYWNVATPKTRLHKFVSVPADLLLTTLKSVDDEIRKMLDRKNKNYVFDKLMSTGFVLKGGITPKEFMEKYL